MNHVQSLGLLQIINSYTCCQVLLKHCLVLGTIHTLSEQHKMVQFCDFLFPNTHVNTGNVYNASMLLFCRWLACIQGLLHSSHHYGLRKPKRSASLLQWHLWVSYCRPILQGRNTSHIWTMCWSGGLFGDLTMVTQQLKGTVDGSEACQEYTYCNCVMHNK